MGDYLSIPILRSTITPLLLEIILLSLLWPYRPHLLQHHFDRFCCMEHNFDHSCYEEHYFDHYYYMDVVFEPCDLTLPSFGDYCYQIDPEVVCS